MDAKNKKQRPPKMSSTQKSTDESSSLLVVDDEANKSTNTDNNTVSSERLTILQNRLHTATSQLGGKGTIRRRRLRKTQSLTSDHNESKQAFINKFDLHDYGQMERITFINDKGEINSYDSVKLNANFKTGIYYLNFSQYKIAKKRRSKTKLMNENQNDTQQEAQAPQKGIRHDTAEEVLKNLEFVYKKENGLLNDLTDLDQRESVSDTLNKIKLEISSLIGSDAYEYLRNLTSKKSQTPPPHSNKKSLSKVGSIENAQDNNESKRISCEKEIELILNQKPSLDYYDDDYIPDVDRFDNEPSSSLQIQTQSNLHSELISTTSDLVNLELDQINTASNQPSSEFCSNNLIINNEENDGNNVINNNNSNNDGANENINNNNELDEIVVITKPDNYDNVRQINITSSMNPNYHGYLEAQNTLSDISNYGEFEDSMDDEPLSQNNSNNNQSLNLLEEEAPSNIKNEINENLTSNFNDSKESEKVELRQNKSPARRKIKKMKLKSRKLTSDPAAGKKQESLIKESDSSFDDSSSESLTSLSSLNNTNSKSANIEESFEVVEIKQNQPVNYSKLSENDSNYDNVEIENNNDNSENQQKNSEDSFELKDLRNFAFLRVKSSKNKKMKKKKTSQPPQKQTKSIDTNELKPIEESKIESTLINQEEGTNFAIKQDKPVKRNKSKKSKKPADLQINNKSNENSFKQSSKLNFSSTNNSNEPNSTSSSNNSSNKNDNTNKQTQLSSPDASTSSVIIDEKHIMEVINAKRKEAAATKHHHSKQKSKHYLVNKKDINNNNINIAKKRSKLNNKESTSANINNSQTSKLNNTDKEILTQEITNLRRERSINENDDNINNSCSKPVEENTTEIVDKINNNEPTNSIKSTSSSNIDNELLFNQLIKDENLEYKSYEIDELKQRQESSNILNGNY